MVSASGFLALDYDDPITDDASDRPVGELIGRRDVAYGTVSRMTVRIHRGSLDSDALLPMSSYCAPSTDLPADTGTEPGTCLSCGSSLSGSWDIL